MDCSRRMCTLCTCTLSFHLSGNIVSFLFLFVFSFFEQSERHKSRIKDDLRLTEGDEACQIISINKIITKFPRNGRVKVLPTVMVMRLGKYADLEQLARNLIWQLQLDRGVCIARFDDGDTFCNMIHRDSKLHEMMRLIKLRQELIFNKKEIPHNRMSDGGLKRVHYCI
jgi:hypothetical protein